MQKTLDFINKRTNNLKPEIGIILGSGLGDFAKNFKSICIPYSEIPGFEQSTVQGHVGQLMFVNGKQETEDEQKAKSKKQKEAIQEETDNLITLSPYNLSNHSSLIIMQGRYHFYEGHSMEKVVYPIKIMKKLGVKTLIITNAAGAINKEFQPADLMIITDHINFMGTNPLIGKNDETLGTRFPDMSEVYKKELIKLADNCAKELGIELKKGVYAAFSGPSYETPAEINMIRTLGADAAGMSTIPEAIVANYCGMNVLGISCISNYAAGVQKTPLSHQEVMETANIAKNKFQSLLLKILDKVSTIQD